VVATFFLAYSTVLIAELLGDKTLYTLGVLATRFRLVPIIAGAALAFALKMAVATALGRFIATLPPGLVTTVSGLTFLAMAGGMLYRLLRPASQEQVRAPVSFGAAFLTSFVALFVPEWGDPGQLAAALLVANREPPVMVWLAGTLAMSTKAMLAGVLGVQLRRWLPQRAMLVASVVVFGALSLLAFTGVEI
jgi:putative Ca2+/H+ antiporter (TMEM165/GDT1 family)